MCQFNTAVSKKAYPFEETGQCCTFEFECFNSITRPRMMRKTLIKADNFMHALKINWN